ncbi:hypothetical protein AB0H70_35900, partial [Streptomyces sp. NPDC050804]
MEAHGGKERWSKVTAVTAVLRIGEPVWALHQVPGVLGSHEVTVDLGTQRTVLRDYTEAGLRGVFTLDRVSVVAEDVRTVEECRHPLASFDGFRTDTPWGRLHALYFVGYATWNYLTAHYLLTLPCVRIRDLAPERPALDPRPASATGSGALASPSRTASRSTPRTRPSTTTSTACSVVWTTRRRLRAAFPPVRMIDG